MAECEICELDHEVTYVLGTRAIAKGVSLEVQVRRTLTVSVTGDCEGLAPRAKEPHAAAGGDPGRPELGSARIIRKERRA